MVSIVQNMEDDEVVVETRDVSPAHFLLKIDSFSLLFKNGIHKYESTEFSAGGYKWKLILSPNGEKDGENDGEKRKKNEDEDKLDHNISVMLALGDTSSLPPRWEFNAVFSIFLYNQKFDNYLSVRGRTRRFHAVKKEWGFPKFISKKTLIDPSNGYLVNDNCVFGAEIFVVENQGIVERLSMLEIGKPYVRSWRIPNFSKLGKQWFSEEFHDKDYTWKMMVHPRGCGDETGRSISAYLCLMDCRISPFHRVTANFTIKIKNQKNGEDHEGSDIASFALSGESWGFANFMPMIDVKEAENDYFVEDCCILEVEISVQSIAHSLSKKLNSCPYIAGKCIPRA